MSTLARVNSLSLLLVITTAAAAQHAGAHWTYSGEQGPSHWGSLSHDYAECSAGHAQSPIDITSTTKADLPAIQVDYASFPLRIIDNGHTVMVSAGPGSSITVGGTKYDLVQFHFHHPSEEEFNGKRHPMVVHLVHKDAAGHLAVIGVMLDVGEANTTVENTWAHIPATKDKEVSDSSVMIDPSGLLPSSRGYYTFAGSLTTPPCSQGVTWFVLKTPVTISQAQLDAFAKLYKMNARPVQPLHGRTVKESQ
jgi:carbonic anhydrase